MLGIFFEYRGVVHYNFPPEGQTVNKKYYLGVMKREFLHFWPKTQQISTELPNLVTTDFFLFSKLALSLRRTRFETTDAIKNKFAAGTGGDPGRGQQKVYG